MTGTGCFVTNPGLQSRFDTNSSSKAAQKFRALQVSFTCEQREHFG